MTSMKTKLQMIWAIIRGRSVGYRLNVRGTFGPRGCGGYIVENTINPSDDGHDSGE